MSSRIVYIPNRVINQNGIADGASLYVYQSGTSTPVSLYSDKNLTVPVANPYVIAAGAAVPVLYSNYKNIRLKIVSAEGYIDDTDPYNPFQLGDYLNSFVTPKDYGAVGDYATDDTLALQNFWNDVILNDLPHDCSGNYAISSQLTIGPAVMPTVYSSRPLVGRMKIKALNAMNEMVHCRFLRYRDCSALEIVVTGTGNSTFASRTCLIGIHMEDCARGSFGRLEGSYFALAAVWWGTANNNFAQVGIELSHFVGSGRTNQSLTGNWSAPANSGTSGSTAQRTQITVDTLPSAAIQGYEIPGTYQMQVRIAGYLYYVYSIIGNNVTIYPWLDNTSVSAGTGTLEWVFGGGHCTRSTDSNRIIVDVLDVDNSSRSVSDAAGYGSIIMNLQSNIVGTEIAVGKTPVSGVPGTQVARYIEGGGSAPSEQIAVLATLGNSNYGTFFGNSGAPDLSKCWALGDPRSTAGLIVGGEFGAQALGSYSVTDKGRLQKYLKSNLTRGPGSTLTLTGQRNLPYIEIYARDSHNLTLAVQGSGEYNRLFGYSGGLVAYIGTGTNGAPSGSFVFTPPVGGTINGGAVDATATFSTFVGPVLFSYEHTDTAQLTWLVRPLTGVQPTTTLTGDVTGSGTSSFATTVAVNAITYSKFQQVATVKLLGNPTGGLANVSEIGLLGGLAFSGTSLTLSGSISVTGVASTGAVTSSSPSAGMGYVTGAGGAVTQATSRVTGVTLNTLCGAITLVSAAGSATYQTFTVTNSQVAATDVVKVCQKSGTDLYIILVTNVAAGSFKISFATTGGTTTEQPVFNFVVNKAVIA